MFGRSTEPFYNWAPLEPFELLDEEFVRAMVVKVNRLSKYPVSRRKLRPRVVPRVRGGRSSRHGYRKVSDF